MFPLGKSPVVSIETPGSSIPTVLAESGAITEYFCDYCGSSLVPQRYREGKDGQIGGETESWLRYRMLMHYAEGSIMPMMLLAIILASMCLLTTRSAHPYTRRNQEFTGILLHQADHQRCRKQS